MDVGGDALRVRLRKKQTLKLRTTTRIGKAFSQEEKDRLLESAKRAHSPHIYPALMIALNTGLRDAEIRRLTWAQLDLDKRYLLVCGARRRQARGEPSR